VHEIYYSIITDYSKTKKLSKKMHRFYYITCAFWTQYQNPVMDVKWKITRFCNWLQYLWLYSWVEVFRCRML